MEILWMPVVAFFVGLPFIVALRVYRTKNETATVDRESEESAEEQRRVETDLALRKVLTKTMKALQKIGAGSAYLVAALRQEEIDGEIAGAALNLQIEHTEKWKDLSTPSAHEHYYQITAILRNAGIELREAGA